MFYFQYSAKAPALKPKYVCVCVKNIVSTLPREFFIKKKNFSLYRDEI